MVSAYCSALRALAHVQHGAQQLDAQGVRRGHRRRCCRHVLQRRLLAGLHAAPHRHRARERAYGRAGSVCSNLQYCGQRAGGRGALHADCVHRPGWVAAGGVDAAACHAQVCASRSQTGGAGDAPGGVAGHVRGAVHGARALHQAPRLLSRRRRARQTPPWHPLQEGRGAHWRRVRLVAGNRQRRYRRCVRLRCHHQHQLPRRVRVVDLRSRSDPPPPLAGQRPVPETDGRAPVLSAGAGVGGLPDPVGCLPAPASRPAPAPPPHSPLHRPAPRDSVDACADEEPGAAVGDGAGALSLLPLHLELQPRPRPLLGSAPAHQPAADPARGPGVDPAARSAGYRRGRAAALPPRPDTTARPALRLSADLFFFLPRACTANVSSKPT
mmetsp:Transcript_24839/g.58999  ORF Transcript_24839/g.58999 Transcript_24839/m.58999 type:complete len:383 (+) Transcript_24839:1900-3048(+)